MTSLHPAPTDPSLPGPPGDSAGSPPPPAVPGTAATTVPMCSIATAAEAGASASGSSGGVIRQGSLSRHDSVPQPRCRDDADAYVLPAAAPATDRSTTDGDPTAARLRAAFAERLRAARAQGRSVAELAAACRRPVAEVRALLGEAAGDGADTFAPAPVRDHGQDGEAGGGTETDGGAEVGGEAEAEVGFVRFPPVAAPEGGLPTRAARPVREELWPMGSRRPSPSRRLRRMHPQATPSGQEATARETAATGPAGVGLPGTTAWTGELAGTAGTVADGVLFGADAATAITPDTRADAGAPGTEAPHAEPPRAEPPLGILIGGSPGQPEAVGRPEERAPVRVVAEPIRVGRGTSLVVLPSWRPAIAVSVSTEQLLSATGLGFEQLADARLTVLMNPSALHDRELELHGWEPGPATRGRRGGRS
ncbi:MULTISPECIES: hypothetical protein [unclassified Kitasatospora]|uniref:hypothetical protein n=1 Tax=unclassified Kitasatospora TaxID=2633591 RepID=UPI0033E781C7